MMIDDTEARVINLLDTYLAGDQTPKPADHLADDLGMDSLDKIELSMLLEREFNLTIDDDVAEVWTTVESVVKAVEGLLQCESR